MSDNVSDHVRDLLRLAVQSLEAGPSRSSESDSRSSASQPTPDTGKNALVERNTLFNYSTGMRKGKAPLQSRPKKIAIWAHSFICLSRTESTRPPISMLMAELMRAGLGRKELHIIDDGDSSDIHSEIMYNFPN